DAHESHHRPGTDHVEQETGAEAHGADRGHQHHESARAERAVRREQRRKERCFILRWCRLCHGSHPDCARWRRVVGHGNMALSPKSGKSTAAKRNETKAGKPRQSKAPGSRLTPAQIDEMFRRFKAVDPHPKTELHYHDPFTLLVAVVLSAQA